MALWNLQQGLVFKSVSQVVYISPIRKHVIFDPYLPFRGVRVWLLLRIHLDWTNKLAFYSLKMDSIRFNTFKMNSNSRKPPTQKDMDSKAMNMKNNSYILYTSGYI